LSSKLYVGNLPFSTTDADLEELFSRYGAVASANVIVDRDTKRSRGFGFVEFESESDAQEAQEALDGSSLEGRDLRVNEAQERQRR
jgi:RNA recognition motif-containing protein